MDFRKISNISVDCVVFGLNSNGINVLLKRRMLCMHDDKYPVIDDWVLAGEHILKSERLDEAAERIFKDYTGLNAVYKKQFRTFGHPERIRSRKDLLWLKSSGFHSRIVSTAYYFLLPADKVKTINKNRQWFPIDELPELGFDHHQIIERAYDDLKDETVIQPLIFEFLHDKFTLNELQFAYESLYDIEIDNRNFRKKAVGKAYVIPLNEKRMLANAKKPAKLFMFSKDVYEKTNTDKNIILAM